MRALSEGDARGPRPSATKSPLAAHAPESTTSPTRLARAIARCAAGLPIALALALSLSSVVACNTPVDEPTESTSHAAYAGTRYSVDQIAAFAKGAGLPCSSIVLATAVAMGESEGYSRATHYNGDGSVDRGLWQINSAAWPMYSESCTFDPACNAKAMAAISNYGASWSHWLAYTNGRYKQFYASAEAAYARGVAGCTGGGGGGGGASPPGGGASSSATCEQLGYEGKCVSGLSVWADQGTCRLRHCAAEGRSCGRISQAEGNGCLGGAAGARVTDCASLGYEGRCFGNVLAWAQDGRCEVVDCAAKGQRCGHGGAIGYDCL